jgi:hypothetical protein
MVTPETESRITAILWLRDNQDNLPYQPHQRNSPMLCVSAGVVVIRMALERLRRLVLGSDDERT